MSTPRLRMIAGPNGSGKSTLLDYLLSNFSFSIDRCLNPDEVERQILDHGTLDLGVWGIRIDEKELADSLRQHPLANAHTLAVLSISENRLVVASSSGMDYLGAIICDFVRRQWVEQRQSFAFETVMSNRDKVDFLATARQLGYRTYLYYVCTDSLVINRERIASRVLQGGHAVPADKIEPRYWRSLDLLPDAISNSSRAYLFDNSGQEHRLIAEFEDARLISISPNLPGWFVKAVLNRKDGRDSA